jgi:hypothetical protein
MSDREQKGVARHVVPPKTLIMSPVKKQAMPSLAGW